MQAPVAQNLAAVGNRGRSAEGDAHVRLPRGPYTTYFT